jgi:hypothetical protein
VAYDPRGLALELDKRKAGSVLFENSLIKEDIL